ncbi:hypothetical protein DA718_09425 [Klebsiella huaxiensis]|uniref:Uncharacterized protein n=1 Tax=Klebsiella huaxiensis TaxID=2153354 RepID=A0A564JHX9_9ENTR|nr:MULTISPECIES: hypothetical protein [Klebsiella]MDG1644386.1 hypothetical protein [Klebsiella huaxiensis]QBG07398.1 hypothetical protein DA718_09425 [Klebsiella huaxiensis]VUS48293.1 hypothetical protein SB6422_00873 [Klebsiella huaxiensis]VUS56351.1 hypothetical protein SB6425_00077 [Klebsiella huaxiensis]VUS63276.1 hypothetical protein SB6421_00447 [Klebsiella huaxiensis]
MHRGEIKWLIVIIFICVLTALAIKSWQYWQRDHFQCSGELSLFNSGFQGDISVRYIFDDERGLAIVRGEITPPQGKPFTINQNIWFSFTRDGQHYFLRSETVSASIGKLEEEEQIKSILPTFFIQPQVPFYLNIQRLNERTRLLYTSRAPSLLCES